MDWGLRAVIDSASSARVLIAELDDGRRVDVPRANVETMDE